MGDGQQEKIKRRLSDLGIKRGLAVDLDDTCFDTTRAYHEGLSANFPAPADVTIEVLRMTYSLHGSLAYWNDIPEAVTRAHALMENTTFNREIHPLAGASAAVRRLQERGIITCYKTARREQMRGVTLEALAKHGFPDLPLMMLEEDYPGWGHIEAKAMSLHASYPQILGIIDDSARLAKAVEQKGYPGEFFLFGLGAAHYQPQNGRVHLARDWQDTEAKVMERYGQLP